MPSSVSDVDRYVIIRNLPDSTINMFPVFIRLWEILKYSHRYTVRFAGRLRSLGRYSSLAD
jgi:hypothetical protein